MAVVEVNLSFGPVLVDRREVMNGNVVTNTPFVLHDGLDHLALLFVDVALLGLGSACVVNFAELAKVHDNLVC